MPTSEKGAPSAPVAPDDTPSPAAGNEAPASAAIAAMVNRFLCWRLPPDFAPDAGITFKPTPHQRGEYGPADPHWPVGTNLLDAGQAQDMLRHVAADLLDREAAVADLIAADLDLDIAIKAFGYIEDHRRITPPEDVRRVSMALEAAWDRRAAALARVQP